MYKYLIAFMALVFLTLNANAQTMCTFSTKGTPKTEYYVTTVSSYKRYKALKRFGATPNYAMITDRKTKAKKIIIL